MKTDFKVYTRKIHIHYRNELTGNVWRYCYSTNAYKTCREAKQDAVFNFPNSDIAANFSKN